MPEVYDYDDEQNDIVVEKDSPDDRTYPSDSLLDF